MLIVKVPSSLIIPVSFTPVGASAISVTLTTCVVVVVKPPSSVAVIVKVYCDVVS